MSTPTPPEPNGRDSARDPWLQRALRGAPDAEHPVPPGLDAAILRAAREAVPSTAPPAPTRPAPARSPSARWRWRWPDWTMPMGLGYSGAGVAVIVAGIWGLGGLEQQARDPEAAAMTAAAPAPIPAAAEQRLGAVEGAEAARASPTPRAQNPQPAPVTPPAGPLPAERPVAPDSAAARAKAVQPQPQPQPHRPAADRAPAPPWPPQAAEARAPKALPAAADTQLPATVPPAAPPAPSPAPAPAAVAPAGAARVAASPSAATSVAAAPEPLALATDRPARKAASPAAAVVQAASPAVPPLKSLRAAAARPGSQWQRGSAAGNVGPEQLGWLQGLADARPAWLPGAAEMPAGEAIRWQVLAGGTWELRLDAATGTVGLSRGTQHWRAVLAPDAAAELAARAARWPAADTER